MDTQTVTFFLAILAVVAQATVASAVVLAAGGRLVPALARVRSVVAAEVGPQALYLAAVVALVCTLGSLWLSEGAHFPPCKLCWYQRIAMYPLVIVIGVAAVRRDRAVRLTGSIIAALGALISCYHLLLERYPSLESAGSCDPTNPCSTKWVERFGYLTIPGMALSGFALILTLLAIARPHPTQESS